jgi:hypothetical protein
MVWVLKPMEDTMTDTPIYTLATLNTLRAKNGMPPLKAWKESKAKLEAAIGKLAAKAPLKDQLEVSAKPKDKPAAKDKPAKVTKPAAKKANVEGVSVSTIAKELGIDPKVARAKLRRQDDVPCIEGSQWLFDKADVSKIKAILKGDARKKDA